MTDNLRDRIAAAMYEQRRLVSRVPMLSDWAGAHPTVQEMWLATADAVIAELGELIAPQYHCIMPDGTHFYPQRTVDE